ncbi:sulfite exporter TauE/SafE family protein [Reyranella sp.]|uniref:sulfite exporter TauE/SafE family protein n=1 Tax=Reyranella sp. TaxID=1929291 RepID=UPI003BACC132
MLDLFSAYSPLIWLALLATGSLIGLLAGLLGVGGGVVAVPVLIEIFEAMEVDRPTALILAVGTAQANIVVASISAATAHWRAGTIDAALVRTWLPALLAGTVAGLWLGSHASAAVLTGTFAAVALALAVQLGASDRLVLGPTPPRGPLGQVPPTIVGVLASAVGVGGGTLSTPVLTLFSFPLKRAIGAGALFNLVIAVPATVFFLIHDIGRPGRTSDAIGDVALICVAALSLPALFVAPIAVRWAMRAPVLMLRRLFAFCLVVVAVRLLLRA